MENPPSMDDFPIETSIYMGFPSQPCLITEGQSKKHVELVLHILSPGSLALLVSYLDSISSCWLPLVPLVQMNLFKKHVPEITFMY